MRAAGTAIKFVDRVMRAGAGTLAFIFLFPLGILLGVIALVMGKSDSALVLPSRGLAAAFWILIVIQVSITLV